MWKLSSFGKRTALIKENGNPISYEKLNHDTEELNRRIPERCLVFSLCRSCYGSVLGYVSFLNHRVVPVLLDAGMERELLWNLICLYKPQYLWVPEDQSESFCNKSGYCRDADMGGYTLIQTPFVQAYPLHRDLALMLTTSGSTGSPKLVKQTYRNLISNTESIIQYLQIDENERAITTLPMNYTYGLSILNTHLYAGASVVLTEKGIMQKDFWQQMKNCHVTSFGGVPYTYEMLEKLHFFNMELPHLQTMTQAGGKLTPELHRRFAEYAERSGKRFIVMYGATEATARMAYLPAQRALDKCGSMGHAIPGGEFCLIDMNGRQIDAPGEIGELVYKGDNVTMGYARSGEDLAKGDERHGIYCTGDMAKRDEEGFYYITGRKKRFLKIFGNRINMDEIEQLVKASFDNLSCACGGKDDRLYLFITEKSQIEEVKSLLIKKTGIHHTAIHVAYVETIPKNESGKTMYAALEKYYD